MTARRTRAEVEACLAVADDGLDPVALTLAAEVRAQRADIRALRTGWNRLYAVIKEPNIRPELAIESLRLMVEAQLAARTPQPAVPNGPTPDAEADLTPAELRVHAATLRAKGYHGAALSYEGMANFAERSAPAEPSTRTVFVVLTRDRHSDPEVELFTDAERAIEVAEEHAAEMGWTDTEIPSSTNWLFAGSHPTESDTICVFPVELRR